MSGYIEHSESSEWPQVPDSTDEHWQDSAFLTWYAPAAGIGGVFRIGYEPNQNGGQVALWFALMTKSGQRYRRCEVAEITHGHGSDRRFRALDGRYQQLFDGRMTYRVRDEGVSLDLEVEDLYERTDFFPPTAGTVKDDIASSHFECSGRITGVVRLEGSEYRVADGLCHRDRSWGPRRWDSVLNYRWMVGSFGPALSFSAVTWNGTDGSLRSFGYVVEDRQVTLATGVDIAVTMEADGITYRRGVATLQLPSGREMSLEAEPFDATLSEHQNVAVVDALSELRLGNNVGFCDLEVSNNPRAGSGPIRTLLRANQTAGLSVRPIAVAV